MVNVKRESQSKVHSEEELAEELAKPGIVVVDAYVSWAGPCTAISGIFKRLKTDHGDDISFIQAQADSIPSLGKFNVKSRPTFLFYASGKLVKAVRGVNAPLIERVVKEQIDLEKSGAERPPYDPSEDLRLNKPERAAESEPAASQEHHVDAEEHAVSSVAGSRSSLNRAASGGLVSSLGTKSIHASRVELGPNTDAHEIDSHLENAKARAQEAVAMERLLGKSVEELSSQPEITYGMIKPDAVHRADEIIDAIRKAGFEILNAGSLEDGSGDTRQVSLSLEKAKEFYKEHAEKPFYETLVSFMTSGPIVPLALKRKNAIKAWRNLLGPTNSIKAKETDPTSLRALFGTDGTMNALHGSDSPTSVLRELGLIFPTASFTEEVAQGLKDTQQAPADDTGNKPERPKSALPVSQSQSQLAAKPATEDEASAAAPAPEGPLERTFAIIKPDAVSNGRVEEIIDRIEEEGFKVVKRVTLKLEREQAEKFYGEHAGKPFFETLVNFMTSGEIVALCLERPNAIRAWRQLMGPTNTQKAKEDSPQSLRALYGTDGTRNAAHGSDSFASAARELEFFFPGENLAEINEKAASSRPVSAKPLVKAESKTLLQQKPLQKTLGLIKPDVVSEGKTDEVIDVIQRAGFRILDRKELTLTKEMAQLFYQEHEGKPFYETLTSWMSSAPIVALLLEKEDAIAEWRALLGPTNSNTARETKPESLRAQYGKDGSQNGFHGSDSVASAERELAFFFPGGADKHEGDEEAPTDGDAAQQAQPEAADAVAVEETQTNEPVEATFAIIKPDVVAAGKKEEVLEEITRHGFKIVEKKELTISKSVAETFYQEHLGKPFYETLTTWMSSGPIVVLKLEKANAIKDWRTLLGPTNSIKARESNPESLRARYGTDGSQNGFHGSDSPASAERELNIFFGKDSILNNKESATEVKEEKQSVRKEQTLGIIKPDVVAAGKVDEVLGLVEKAGFSILEKKQTTITTEQAKEFYKEHDGKPFYETLTTWMSSLRALYGTDGSQNGFHGSDSPASAARELGFFFSKNEAANSNSTETDAPQPVIQQTFGIIKPDVVAAGKADEALALAEKAGFKILEKKQIVITKEQAQEFYKEHEGKPFYETLTTWMSSGPIIVLKLEKEDAILSWRALLGPTNSIKARETAPESLRARYGTDGSQNGFHGSDSVASAERELAFFFDANTGVATKAPKPVQQTFGIIKPDVVAAGKADEALALAEKAGFKILEKKQIAITKEQAQEFYKEHEGKPFYETLTTWMSSGPIVVLKLEKEDGILGWRGLLGPTNSNKARETSPESLRALYGTDGSQNGFHGSDSVASATRELEFFFGDKGVATLYKESEPQSTESGSNDSDGAAVNTDAQAAESVPATDGESSTNEQAAANEESTTSNDSAATNDESSTNQHAAANEEAGTNNDESAVNEESATHEEVANKDESAAAHETNDADPTEDATDASVSAESAEPTTAPADDAKEENSAPANEEAAAE